jgi:hypothetical protein
MPKPWLKISDKYADDLAVARAEHHQRRVAMGSIDAVDRLAMRLATSLLNTDELVALLRRKPLLGEIDPAAYQVILEAIDEAAKASPRERRKRWTTVLHKMLAAEVNARMTHIEPASSKKTIMHDVAAHRGWIFEPLSAHARSMVCERCERQSAKRTLISGGRFFSHVFRLPTYGFARNKAVKASKRATHGTGRFKPQARLHNC